MKRGCDAEYLGDDGWYESNDCDNACCDDYECYNQNVNAGKAGPAGNCKKKKDTEDEWLCYRCKPKRKHYLFTKFDS